MSLRIDRARVQVERSRPLRIQDTLSFVEDGDFLDEFYACGLHDDDLEIIQRAITVAPTGGEVVPVSANIRDCFYSSEPGESVVIRYVYLEPANTVLLLTAFPGVETEPFILTEAEAGEAEAYIKRQTEFFCSRYTR